MSKEKVEFKLPVVFTLVPVDPDTKPLIFANYARIMNGLNYEQIREIIGGMVEGEMRGLTASLDVEELFSQKDIFRQHVVEKIQPILERLGLEIYSANIKEMTDYDEKNKYFEYRKQRAIETANYEAQGAVAEAQRDGETRVAEMVRDARIRKAQFEQEAKIKENEMKQLVAQSDAQLAVSKAEAQQKGEIVETQARMAVRQKEMDLLKTLTEREKEQQMEHFRATRLAEATVEAESIERLATAKLFEQQKVAEGQLALLEAQAQGLEKVVAATGPSGTELVKFYLGLNANLYPELAAKAADAVQGLNPKVTIWNTGAPGGQESIAVPFLKLVQSFAPTLDTVLKQVVSPEEEKRLVTTSNGL